MRIIQKMLRQCCWYWAPNGHDLYGKQIFWPPVELQCRWEDSLQEVVTHQGQTVMSVAKVYTACDVVVGGSLSLLVPGEPAAPLDPADARGAFEIKRFDKVPTLKADQFLRVAYL